MKREKRTTKKERKAALRASGVAAVRTTTTPSRQQQQQHQHIHCVACGIHLEPDMFGPGGADFYRCKHGGDFPHCAGCALQAKALVDEHDRTGQAVQKAAIWH